MHVFFYPMSHVNENVFRAQNRPLITGVRYPWALGLQSDRSLLKRNHLVMKVIVHYELLKEKERVMLQICKGALVYRHV